MVFGSVSSIFLKVVWFWFGLTISLSEWFGFGFGSGSVKFQWFDGFGFGSRKRFPSLLKTLENEYALSLGTRLTATQLLKKINNMKNEIKKKIDKNTTGNKKIILKDWEKEFLELLQADENPVFTKIDGKKECRNFKI